MVKKFKLLVLVLIGLTSMVQAQQDPQYSQFMYNKLPINSAYTGGRDVLSIRALYRNQWVGLEGSPQTATFSVHSPLKNEDIALGFNIVHDRLGTINQTVVSGTYAYRIPIKNGMKFSFGVNAGFMYHVNKLSEAAVNDIGDVGLQENVSRIVPDVGAGIYIYHPEWFYIGVSVPNFITSDVISKERSEAAPLVGGSNSQRTQHLMAMAGGVIPLGTKALKLRPQVMFKHVINAEYDAPFSIDLNASFLIYDRVNIGASYRTTFGKRDSPDRLEDPYGVSGMVEFWATKQLLIGYAYDYPLNKISDVTNGSHEIILGFDFDFDKKKIITPRYF
ncbi:MAG: type IX secretion system membrane protein PorP/SprF [Chitinophagales bacterium]